MRYFVLFDIRTKHQPPPFFILLKKQFTNLVFKKEKNVNCSFVDKGKVVRGIISFISQEALCYIFLGTTIFSHWKQDLLDKQHTIAIFWRVIARIIIRITIRSAPVKMIQARDGALVSNLGSCLFVLVKESELLPVRYLHTQYSPIIFQFELKRKNLCLPFNIDVGLIIAYFEGFALKGTFRKQISTAGIENTVFRVF